MSGTTAILLHRVLDMDSPDNLAQEENQSSAVTKKIMDFQIDAEQGITSLINY
jgi:hypothetical protein